MRICVNGICRDMTAEEEQAYKESISASDVSTEEDKLIRLEKQVSKNTEDITATQEALCELYETVV